MKSLPNELVLNHLYLASKVARYSKAKIRFLSFEELEMEMQEALVEAANSFDAERGVPFEAYATIQLQFRVRHLIADHVRRRKITAKLALEVTRGVTNKQQEEPQPEVVLVAGSALEAKMMKACLENPGFGKHGVSSVELAKKLGVSRRTISAIRLKIRKEIEKDGQKDLP
jgi:DNA-directed RNA polymerase sigma subunit (sigma70/sigma32)